MSGTDANDHSNSATSDVSSWYDDFTEHQRALGINIRHRTILRNARKLGILGSARVLEIGCGIGTVTSLLAKHNRQGQVLAVDISPKSIEIARRNLKDLKNVSFLVSDMSDFQRSERFDLVVLPDVIEHIPVDQHPRLFATIARHLATDARVLINVPCAQLLEYLHVHDPKVLQVIDQPIHAHDLMRTVYGAGLVLESFTSYGLQYEETEYHSIVLRQAYRNEGLQRKSKWALRWAELRSRSPW